MMGGQWHQMDHMHIICTSIQTSITMPAPHHSIFLQAGCSSGRPTVSSDRRQSVQHRTVLIISHPPYNHHCWDLLSTKGRGCVINLPNHTTTTTVLWPFVRDYPGGSVAEWLRRWTCNSQVASSIPSLGTVE